jgi:hypothetical protein
MSLFEYLGMKVANQSLIEEEINMRLNSCNATLQSRTFFFLSAIKSNKNYIIQDYSFTCGSVWTEESIMSIEKFSELIGN